MRALCMAALALSVTATSDRASAQEEPDELTVAFFAPSLYFSDSVARAGFISSLAERVEEEIGRPVRGINISRSSDLSGADFAIVDGQHYAGSEQGRAFLSAESDGATSAQLALIAGAGGPTRVSELRGATLILPRVGDTLEDFLAAEVLRGEVSPAEFFGQIEYTSNVESALSAVSSGRADATLAFAEYGDGGGLSVLERYSEAPYAVLIQLDDRLPDDVAEGVQRAVRSMSGSGSISGFSSYDSDSVSSFRRAASRSRPSRAPIMLRARTVEVDVGDLELEEVEEALPLPAPVGLIRVPEMDEP